MKTPLLALFVLVGCGDHEEEEARNLVAHVRALDPQLPIADRRSLLEQLDQLNLRTERLRPVRQTCVEAHGSLVEAEEKGDEARAAIRAAGGQELQGEARAAVEQMLQTQERSIARAEELLPQCEREVDALSLRYAGSRPARTE